ncbi:MAG: hypothetical protein M3Z66_03155 [Chloroflexota bacterium]|nr:hypothetical protein [Chloroflexota bacterium]
MTYMGWAFESPRRHHAVQWRKVEMIRRAGFYFWGNQNWPALKTLREARDFIAGLDHEKQKKQEIERRAHVKRLQKRAARSRAKRRARAG